MIKNVIFDIGNVLADFRYRDYMQKDLGFSGELTELFVERLVMNELWNEFDLGVKDSEVIINEMKAAVSEYPEEAAVFFDHIEDIAASYPYSYDWLKELKDRGLGVYLLSNYPRDVFTIHEKKHFRFTELADGKVVSGFERMSKPDPRIYELLLTRYGLKAEECAFIDDRQINIDAACALGINGILFKSYEQAKEDLALIL
ncbi:MAG: HAD family phosphatase [Lachnospiraceae bacterium]|nr:HAD family phosphatase [Lachnospiraceae bacterium]